MSGTRAKTIRADIAAALSGVTLDPAARSSDKLTFLDVPRLPESARDRSFRVIVAAPPHLDDTLSGSMFRVEFTIEIFYALGPGIEDRICDDTERFWWALNTLQAVNADVQLPEPSTFGVEETPNNYIVRIGVVVRYRVSDSIL